MADELTVISTFANRIDAEIARGALEASGIDAVLSADDAFGIRPDLGRRGVHVLVRGEDVDEARAVLGNRDSEAPRSD